MGIVTGVWGGAGFRGQCPWSGGQGQSPLQPLESEKFCIKRHFNTYINNIGSKLH